MVPENEVGRPVAPSSGTAPTDVFRRPPTSSPQPQPPTTPQQQQPPSSIWKQTPPGTSSSLDNGVAPPTSAASLTATSLSTAEVGGATPDLAALRLAPRMAPQPASIALGPGEPKLWTIVGMDLEGLTTPALLLQFDAKHMDVTDIAFGPAIAVNPQLPPIVTINRDLGTIRIASSDGKPLTFVSGGEVLSIRVHGGLVGETFLVMANPEFHDAHGKVVTAAVSGGRARVD